MFYNSSLPEEKGMIDSKMEVWSGRERERERERSECRRGTVPEVRMMQKKRGAVKREKGST